MQRDVNMQGPSAARLPREHASTIAALGESACYPEAPREVEVVETHMSWVFLTERHAYKLKKPIRTSSLDYTTSDARRAACEAELVLNRRLAPTVYLGVVPVVVDAGRVQVEGLGTPIDWLIKMRRLPRDRMLDVCVARGTATQEDLNRLAGTLDDFYRHAERASLDGSTYYHRIESDIEAKCACLGQRQYMLSRADVRAVLSRLKRWLVRNGQLVQDRASTVVDAHGDLRPEHICLETPPVVIDCLEFCRSLRLLDPISELSFLALECRRLGVPWVGEHVLARYSELSGDNPPPSLIAFYQSYHAAVRAAIAIWHLDDASTVPTRRWRQRANSYLALAQDLL